MPENDSRQPTPTPAIQLLIRWARSQRKYLTPADLSRIIGVSRATITNWLNKGADVSIDTLAKIANGTTAYNHASPPDYGPDYPFDGPGIPLDELLAAQGIRLPDVDEMWEVVEQTIRQTELNEKERARLIANIREARRKLTAVKLATIGATVDPPVSRAVS